MADRDVALPQGLLLPDESRTERRRGLAKPGKIDCLTAAWPYVACQRAPGRRQAYCGLPPREPGHPQRGRALTIPRRVHQDRARGTRPPESQQRPGDSGIIAGNGPALLAPSPEERGMSSYQITRVRRSSLTAGDHQPMPLLVGCELSF